MKIMVVDDEKDIQILFQQRFRKEIKSKNLDFIFAFSGEEAIQLLNVKDQERLGVVLNSGRRLMSLINDILDLSKIESGHLDIRIKEFSLRSVIETILEQVNPVSYKSKTS